jgi:hypothetical protein
MVRCLLCDKELKTNRGLSVHLSRTHNVHGVHGRLALSVIRKFFPLLQKHRWAKAEQLLTRLKQNAEDDEWIKGYTHALNGMLEGLKTSYSAPQPFILSVKEFSTKKLQEVKDSFRNLSAVLESKKEFDTAYFQAWQDFTNYVINKQKKPNSF